MGATESWDLDSAVERVTETILPFTGVWRVASGVEPCWLVEDATTGTPMGDITASRVTLFQLAVLLLLFVRDRTVCVPLSLPSTDPARTLLQSSYDVSAGENALLG